MTAIFAFAGPRAIACALFLILPVLPYLGHRLLCRQCRRPLEPADPHAAGPFSFDGIPDYDRVAFKAEMLGLSGEMERAARRHGRKHLGERN